VSQRHVAMKDVRRDHPGEVDRILRTAELRCVAEFGFFEVVNRPASWMAMARVLIRLSTAGPSSPRACAPRTRPLDLRKMTFKPSILAPG